MARDGKRAYTNNELNTSISALNLDEQHRDRARHRVERAAGAGHAGASQPGRQARVLHGARPSRQARHQRRRPVRRRAARHRSAGDIAARRPNNAWSSCASCHDDGHSDNVTWIFETGPRQTIPLEGTFARNNLDDQRILNWSAVRGSNTDFNNNARGIQGGNGFATNVDGVDKTAQVFNHGPTQGHQRFAGRHERVGGDGARADHAGHRRPTPKPRPRAVHDELRELPWRHEVDQEPHERASIRTTRCCRPIRSAPRSSPAVRPRTMRASTLAGPQVVSVTRAGKATLLMLDNVGTFNLASPIEIRGAAAVAGQTTQGFGAFGAGGFNSPSLLGVAYSGPYFHDGSAHTLEEVAARHRLGGAGDDRQRLNAQELADLLAFVRSIDDDTHDAQRHRPVHQEVDRTA